jgi:hypothetical protein
MTKVKNALSSKTTVDPLTNANTLSTNNSLVSQYPAIAPLWVVIREDAPFQAIRPFRYLQKR